MKLLRSQRLRPARGPVLSAGRPKGQFSNSANVNIEHLSAIVKKPIWILVAPNRTTRRSRLDHLALKRTSIAGTEKHIAPNEQLDAHIRPVRKLRGTRYKTPETGNPNNPNALALYTNDYRPVIGSSQLSVRKGEAGRPSLLARLHAGLAAQA